MGGCTGCTDGLPLELRLRILSLLPPNDLALSGRLSCKQAAQHFTKQQHRTASCRQPLPCHVLSTPSFMESVAGAMRLLAFRHKLHLPGWAAASGCETNVEYALQLLQPHVFPELLHSTHYRIFRQFHTRWGLPCPVTDVGGPAVASGLAHLLPSLERRCPGLVDPGRTLEAAARHCDLPGLEAAWKVLGQRLRREVEQAVQPDPDATAFMRKRWTLKVHGGWRRILAAAAGSPTPDAIAKMAWALDKGHAYGDARVPIEHADVCGAAAASGDLARVRWLRAHDGFPWGTVETLAAVMQHADLGFIQQLEREGGYLPPVGDQAWSRHETALAAAAATRDSAAKLHWLADRVLQPLPTPLLLQQAVIHSNWEALAVLVEPEHCPPSAPLGAEPLPPERLQQQHRQRLSGVDFTHAFFSGNLDVLRWMLQAGCQRLGSDSLEVAVGSWSVDTPAHCEQLVEALRLLAAAGWPVAGADEVRHPLRTAAEQHHPWPVWRAIHELLSAGSQPGANVPIAAVRFASAAGCEATLEALVGLGFGSTGARHSDPSVADEWYIRAASNGDLATLTVLRRLGVPIRAGVLERAATDFMAPLPALKWLVQQGAPWSAESMRGPMRWNSRGMPRRPPQEQQQVVVWLRSLVEPPAAAGVVVWLRSLVEPPAAAGVVVWLRSLVEPPAAAGVVVWLRSLVEPPAAAGVVVWLRSLVEPPAAAGVVVWLRSLVEPPAAAGVVVWLRSLLRSPAAAGKP